MMIARTDDIDACIAIRREVFIDEQNVPEAEELDDLDAGAIHILARDVEGEAWGTARLLIQGATGKIGRVAVRKGARGTGLGARLIEASIAELGRMPGVTMSMSEPMTSRTISVSAAEQTMPSMPAVRACSARRRTRSRTASP